MGFREENGFTTSHVVVLCIVAAVIGFFLYNSSDNQGSDYQAVLNAGQEDTPALSALAAVMDQRQQERQQASGAVNQAPEQPDVTPPFNPHITAVRADFLVGTDRRGKKEFDEELFVTIKFYILEKNLRSVQILRGENHFMDVNPQPVSKKKGNKWLYFWTDKMKLPNRYTVVATDIYDQTHKKVYHLEQPRKRSWQYQAGPRHYTMKLSRTDNRAVDDILMRMGPKRYKKKKKKKTPDGFPQSSRTF